MAPVLRAIVPVLTYAHWHMTQALQALPDPCPWPALVKSLRDAGFKTRWVRPPGALGDLAGSEIAMELRVVTGSQLLPSGLRAEVTSTLQVRRSALDQYLIELVDQDTWIQGMRRMMADPAAQGRPWPTYRGEDRVWL